MGDARPNNPDIPLECVTPRNKNGLFDFQVKKAVLTDCADIVFSHPKAKCRVLEQNGSDLFGFENSIYALNWFDGSLLSGN